MKRYVSCSGYKNDQRQTITNKEAINLISRNKSVFQYDTEMTKALNLAIKAFKFIDNYYSNQFDDYLKDVENR